MASRTVSPSCGWLARLQASIEKNRSVRESSYYQIATVGRNGRPRNRTVVHRDLKPNGQLQFVTDARSRKVSEAGPATTLAEISWYLPVTREQYRVFGSLAFHGEDATDPSVQEERQAAWKKMSEVGQQQFVWPQPGEPRTEEDLARGQKAPVDAPPATFALAILTPEEVDVVDLVANTRTLWRRSGSQGWESTAINP